MPYIYPHARLLHGNDKVGDEQPVTLIRHFTQAPPPGAWREGEQVVGNTSLTAGTAIATFEDGKYPDMEADNHAALYLYQVADGIYVVDQRPGGPAQQSGMSQRYIPRLGKDKAGRFIHPSNNADAFSVIR